jgi:hypothetical protein
LSMGHVVGRCNVDGDLAGILVIAIVIVTNSVVFLIIVDIIIAATLLMSRWDCTWWQ